MSYFNRPHGSNYYEAEREVIREGPYGSYSAEYRIDEYGNRVPHHHHHHNHHNGIGGGEFMGDMSGGYHHHHHHNHGRPTEIIERREEYIVDNASYDPCRRMY